MIHENIEKKKTCIKIRGRYTEIIQLFKLRKINRADQ